MSDAAGLIVVETPPWIPQRKATLPVGRADEKARKDGDVVVGYPRGCRRGGEIREIRIHEG